MERCIALQEKQEGGMSSNINLVVTIHDFMLACHPENESMVVGPNTVHRSVTNQQMAHQVEGLGWSVNMLDSVIFS